MVWSETFLSYSSQDNFSQSPVQRSVLNITCRRKFVLVVPKFSDCFSFSQHLNLNNIHYNLIICTGQQFQTMYVPSLPPTSAHVNIPIAVTCRGPCKCIGGELLLAGLIFNVSGCSGRQQAAADQHDLSPDQLPLFRAAVITLLLRTPHHTAR